MVIVLLLSIAAIIFNFKGSEELNNEKIQVSKYILIADSVAMILSRVSDYISIFRVSEPKSPFSKNQKSYIVSKNSLLKASTYKDIRERSLIECLHLFADEMKAYLNKNCYYELSVFSNKEHPDIIAYYDTNKNTCADSKAKRMQNENYYRDKKYQVVELLDNPTTLPIYLPHVKVNSGYSFVDKKQKQQIKSQVMLCFHLENPCVLVVTANKKNTFSKKDTEFEETLKHIVLLLESNIVASEKYMCNKEFLCMNNS